MIAILEHLGAHFVAFSFEAAVLIMVIAIADRLLKQTPSAFRYLLWVLVLVRLAVPVSMPVPDTVSSWVRNLLIKQEPVAQYQMSTPYTVTEESVTIMPVFDPVPLDRQLIAEERFVPPVSFQAMAGGALIMGAGVLLVTVLIRWIVLRHALSKSVALGGNVIGGLVARLSHMIGLSRQVAVHVWGVQSTEAVALAGVTSPRILLPRGMADTWPPEDLEPVILHELAHVKRADLIVNWFQVILQAVYFFHPLVWYMNSRIRHLREEACDDLALSALGGSRKRYAESILRVLDETTSAPAFGFAALGFSERRSNIGERIRRIMTSDGSFSTRLTARAACGLAAVLIAALAISCGAGSVWRKGDGDELHAERPSVTIVDAFYQDMTQDARQTAVKTFLSTADIDRHITLAALRVSDSDDMLVDAIRNVASAVSHETGLDVSVREMTPGDPALLDCSVAFVLGTDDIRRITTGEAANLAAFMRGGGFVFADLFDPSQEYGQQEAGLRLLLKDVLESDYRPLPIPNNYPLYHCYYDIDMDGDMVPEYNDTGGVSFSKHLYFEGFHADDKLVGMLSEKAYINHWAASDTGDAMELGINIVLFDILRDHEGFMAAGEDRRVPLAPAGMPMSRSIALRNDLIDAQDDTSSFKRLFTFPEKHRVSNNQEYQLVRAVLDDDAEPDDLSESFLTWAAAGFALGKVAMGDSMVFQIFDSTCDLDDWDGYRTVSAEEHEHLIDEFSLVAGPVPELPEAPDLSELDINFRIVRPQEDASLNNNGSILSPPLNPTLIEKLDGGSYLINGEVVDKDDLVRFSDAVIVKDAEMNAPSRPVADNSSVNVAISGQVVNKQTIDRTDGSPEIPAVVQSAGIPPAAAAPDVGAPAQYLLPKDAFIPLIEEEGETCGGATISFAVVNDSTYLVDDVEVHRDDLEDVVRAKSFDMVDMLTRLNDPFGPYAYLWNTIQRVSSEQAGEHKFLVQDDVVVDVIDENTVRLAGREMSLTDIEGAIGDIIDSDTRYRLIIRGDADLPMRTISDVEQAASNNRIPVETKYVVR